MRHSHIIFIVAAFFNSVFLVSAAPTVFHSPDSQPLPALSSDLSFPETRTTHATTNNAGDILNIHHNLQPPNNRYIKPELKSRVEAWRQNIAPYEKLERPKTELPETAGRRRVSGVEEKEIQRVKKEVFPDVQRVRRKQEEDEEIVRLKREVGFAIERGRILSKRRGTARMGTGD